MAAKGKNSKENTKGRNTTVISNRRARFDYHLLEQFTAGIVLTGTEVKSLRAGKANLQDAFCYLDNNEVFLKNMQINEYDKGSYNNHDPKRVRKLLLKKKEIRKMRKGLEVKGQTLVPLKVYFSARNYAKVDIALAEGKKNFDKRADLKEKDSKRELNRMMKQYN